MFTTYRARRISASLPCLIITCAMSRLINTTVAKTK